MVKFPEDGKELYLHEMELKKALPDSIKNATGASPSESIARPLLIIFSKYLPEVNPEPMNNETVRRQSKCNPSVRMEVAFTLS